LGLNLDAILPLQPQGIRLLKATDTEVSFHVPLDPNINDKGTLFAGSQYSGLVISGWYLASQWAKSQNLGEKVAVKDCSVSYPKAALSDITATAVFKQAPDKRPSGHWRVLVEVTGIDEQGGITSVLKGDYRIIQS
jgi:thioesterase domain-containing protein